MKRKCAWDAHAGSNICAWQPLMPGEDPTDECTTNEQCAAITTPIPTPTGGWAPTLAPTGSGGSGNPTSTPTAGSGGGEQGCKPCPNSSLRAQAGTTSYSCDGDDTGLQNFTLWQEDYLRTINGEQIPADQMYADYNCNGAIDIGDFTLWLEHYLENYN